MDRIIVCGDREVDLAAGDKRTRTTEGLFFFCFPVYGKQTPSLRGATSP